MAWQSAVSGVKQCGRAPTAWPAPSVQSPACTFGTLHVLSPWWTLDILNLGLLCAGLECLGEGLRTWYFTGSSFPFFGAEVKMRT